MPQVRLDRLQAPEAYQGSRPSVFPSATSLEWRMREDRARLVEAGAMAFVGGRWLVDPQRFDRVIAKLSVERTRARSGLARPASPSAE